MVDSLVEKCPTGIEGFDLISRGGFVRNSNNVILGGPGSGKTTFMLQFLWNGAQNHNENGVYCSFEPDIIETLKDALSHGWDFTKLNEQDKVKFLKFSPHTSIDELKSELTRIVAKYNIRRICFDPVSVLALNINDEGKVREMIFDLVSLMKRLRVTTIMADEASEDRDIGAGELTPFHKMNIIKFLSDSVITFYESGLSGEGDRAVRIIKMRRTNHIRTLVGMNITSKGIEVIPEEGLFPKEIQLQKQSDALVVPKPPENLQMQQKISQQPQMVQNRSQMPVVQNRQIVRPNVQPVRQNIQQTRQPPVYTRKIV